jgi:carboxyl-terminal processing protease
MRSRLIFMIVSVVCLAPFAMGALVDAGTEGEDSLYKQLSVLSEVLTLIQRTYVDETSIGKLLDGALEGATDALDPLATFVPAEQADAYAETRRVGSSRSGLVVAKDRGIAYVVAVIDGSPGATAEIEQGDVLAAVDGQSTRNMPLWQLEGMLAGESGTDLPLELLRNGQETQVKLALGDFARPEPGITRRDEIAVLRLPSVDEAAVGAVRDLLSGVAGEDRLIVDLRGSANGEAEAAYRIAGLFTRGRLGLLTARGAELQSFDNDLPPLWEGSIAVIIDGGTLGAAEVLAAVLQQSAGAVLVGEPSFGLAGRRGLVKLPSGGQVMMTDALFTGPDGQPIDERLRPDEPVRESLRSLRDASVTLDDLMLDRAVEVLRRAEQKAA